MSAKVKPISDPESKNGKTVELPATMNLREIQVCESKEGEKTVKIAPLKNMVSEDKVKKMKRMGEKGSTIDCIKLAELVLDSIESIENHKGFTIGKEPNKVYCGHVIQRIPMGGYARIGGGESIFAPLPPVQRKPKLIFKFDKKRQMALKVGNTVGKDWVVVVTANGCIFLDSASYASFHLPVYIMEQTGNYYKVDSGNRILLLGAGHHLMFYTKQAPILFVRKHTVTHEKSIPQSSLPKSSSLKSNSLASNGAEEANKKESKEEHKKEAPKKEAPKITIDEVVKPKSQEKLKPEVQTPPPKVKEIKGLSKSILNKQRPKPSPKTKEVSNVTLVEPEEHRNRRKYIILFGLILLLLLVFYVLYRYFSGGSPSTGKPPPRAPRAPKAHKPSNQMQRTGKQCRICNSNFL